MFLSLMKQRDRPSVEPPFHPLPPSLAVRLNGLIPTMTTEAQKTGACYGLTKYPCNRRHQIQFSYFFCNTRVECGVSFLHLQGNSTLAKKTLRQSLSSLRNVHTREVNAHTWTFGTHTTDICDQR